MNEKNSNLSIRSKVAKIVLFSNFLSIVALSFLSYIIINNTNFNNTHNFYFLIILTLLLHSTILIITQYNMIHGAIKKFLKSFANILQSSSYESVGLDFEGNLANIDETLNNLFGQISESLKTSGEYAEELRISNEKLQHSNEIIEKSSIVVFEWALLPGVPVIFVTKNISQFGYTDEEFYSGAVDYWDFVYEEDREKTQNTVWNARKTSVREYKHSYRVTCKNGDIRWVEEWVLLERDESGTPVSEKGMLRDITEQIEIAQKLKESEERYRGLFENACAVICTFNLKGNFTSVNNACSEVTGYSREELLSMNMAELAPVDKREAFINRNKLEFVSDKLGRTEIMEIVSKEGKHIILECRSIIIYKNGNPVEIQTIAQDITSRKLAEEKINYLSMHDKLTGLFNRAYFDEKLKSLDENREYPFSIIIGDMNGLKLANDAFGHENGDNLLIETARILETACRKTDIVARLGGDEFAVILPNTDEIETVSVCERIKKLCTLSGFKPVQPSIALGYAAKDSAIHTIEELIKKADDKMYKNKFNESKRMTNSIIETLQNTLNERSLETKDHTERMRALALKLGERLKLSESKLDELSIAVLMHDIGKIAIPDETLLKQGKLNENEWATVKRHPEIGYHIILSSLRMASIAEYILSHHERWDGEGYPRQLKGENIPMISRIISIVDAYDVMLHNKPYGKTVSKTEAINELQRCSGSQFDPQLVNEFIKMIN
ncbi:MAG: HD domain-containing phosphohydrolase [Caulobacteraceae bacterium]